MTENKTGVQEIGDKSYSIYDGCKNNCQYPCWARLIRRKKQEVWKNPVFNEKWFNQKISKYYPGGVFLFGLHDIYRENVETCGKFILRVLEESENNIKIVTKPESYSIVYLCDILKEYKERITFVFTITTDNNDLIREFEPNAPLYSDRFGALYYTKVLAGYKTSILCEPFLDENPVPLIEHLSKYVTDTFWLGCMSNRNYIHHNKDNLIKIKNEIQKLGLKVQFKSTFRNKINKK